MTGGKPPEGLERPEPGPAKRLPPLPGGAERLFDVFGKAGEELYLVGGYVRDLMMGRYSEDIDLATSAPPERSLEILESNGIKVFPIGMEFGTVAAILQGPDRRIQAEITTYRTKESYRKGSRHPEVAFGESLREDLVRRDFTVNAMAMGPDGQLIDPLDGLADLRRKLIRTTRKAESTFEEDPLRILRAVRFACALGFELDADVERAMESMSGCIREVSRERWKQELDKVMEVESGERVAEAFQIMGRTSLLCAMVPELRPMVEFSRDRHGSYQGKGVWEHTLDVLRRLDGSTPCTRWAALFHDCGKSATLTVDDDEVHFYGHEKVGEEIFLRAAEELRFPRKERACVALLVRNHMRPGQYEPQWRDSAVNRLARRAGEHLDELLELSKADISSYVEARAARSLQNLYALRERLDELSSMVEKRLLPRKMGSAIRKALGGREGPVIGRLKSILEDAVADGELPAEADKQIYIDYLRRRGLLRREDGD
ncbi:HD domain-containing protein [Candidatus Fermentibacteria bacterium]|nr:HD domain-containing protein [Candidatus Fermentibacteria bacterium]